MIIKVYEKDTTWTCPAGVRRVLLHGYEHAQNKVQGGSHLVTQNGVVYGWGANAHGQLGDNTVIVKSTPVVIVGGPATAKAITGSFRTTSILSRDGLLYATGRGSTGMLGDNTVVDKSTPVLVVGGHAEASTRQAPGWKKVSFCEGMVIEDHALALNYDGRIYSWGQNTFGQRGLSTTGSTRAYPSQTVQGGKKWKDVCAGGECSFAIDEDGNLYSWGRNDVGQLGLGDTTDRSSPVLVPGGLKWKLIGEQFGLTEDGSLYAWGINFFGQIGDGTTVAKSSPVLVSSLGAGTHFTKIGQAHTAGSGIGQARFAMEIAGGTIYCWGTNTQGLLGNNAITSLSVADAVVSLQSFVEIQADGGQVGCVLAVSKDGQVYAWGANPNGQLGDNSVAAKSTPVLVLGGHRIQQDPAIPKILVDVTPGQTYSIYINRYFATFAGITVGRLLRGVIIEY